MQVNRHERCHLFLIFDGPFMVSGIPVMLAFPWPLSMAFETPDQIPGRGKVNRGSLWDQGGQQTSHAV